MIWIVAEAAVLCGLGLIAIFWLIPAETTSGGIGLDPATLPTACIVAAITLSALDAAVRLARPSPVAAQLPASPAIRVIAVCIVAGVLLPLMHLAVLVLLLLPPLMLMLGDRHPLRIAATTVLTAAVIALALLWRG